MTVYIRNMACESCKVVVKDALHKLKLTPTRVELGIAEIKEDLSEAKKEKLNKILNEVGLEVVEGKGAILIENIKKHCNDYVESQAGIKVNISDYLSKRLNKDYNYLSNAFSEVELCTIVHYINQIKMEKAKEMILFEELNFTEIATKLNFNNLSAFSTLFKKITGFSPTHFKKLKDKRRLTMQQIMKKP